jgi:hypothetical protein
VFSSFAIRHRTLLHANDPAPPFELPLHELYHQLEYQAVRRLGLDLPSNHEPRRVAGRTLSPRTWVAPNPRVLDWYDEVLGRQLHPDLFRDLYPTDRDDVEPGDLARAAAVDAAGVDDPGRLVDGAVYGPPASTLDPDAGFTLSWSAPVPVTRVVAHLTDRPGGAPTAARMVVWGREPGGWRALAEAELGVQPRVELEIPETTVDSVRVTVVDPTADEVSCLELEVYGPAHQ